ncbi:inositol monophosphatase family protein [Nocardia sp. NPDC057227]|uniref:inositol monophosphatase family protein n=1 Tax=Nocardia sp. NPDC057227 TaxID=3346056 RepID=UPI003635854B
MRTREAATAPGLIRAGGFAAPTVSTVAQAAARVAIAAAEEAGAVIRGGLHGALGISVKDAGGDLVTELDLRAERIILDRIRGAFPGHRVLAEESGLLEGFDDDWTWVVDPLDGTNNIAIGLPVCTVGIALCHRGSPVLGVVHEPVAGHTWSAIRGHGAHGPDGRLRCGSAPAAGSGPVLAWLQGYPIRRTDPAARALRLTLEAGSRRLIQLWSPLLCWIMLSRGDIDGFVGYGAGQIDLPAGTLIAREAGVRIVGFDGAPLAEHITPAGGAIDFVAARPEVLPALAGLVESAAGVRVSGLPG